MKVASIASVEVGLGVLAVAAGLVDAISYLALGHVFTANMTGNTVLLGLAVGQAKGAEAARSAVALGGFCTGVAVGAYLTRSRHGRRVRQARAALAAEAMLLLLRLALRGARSSGRLAAVRARSAFATAMGLQSAAVRAIRVPGVATTYVTGTLTNALSKLVDRLGSLSTLGQQEGPPAGRRSGVLATVI